MKSKSLSIVKYLTISETLQGTEEGGFEISNLEKLRVVIENASGSNSVTFKVKIKGQSSYTTLTTLTGSTNSLIDVRTYDLLQIVINTVDGSAPKLIVVGFDLPANPTAEYSDFSNFPSASGSGDFAWDAANNKLYYDEPSSMTWIEVGSSGGGSSSLTSTYVGYGSAINELSGEAVFTYNETTNTLSVPNFTLNGTNVNSTLYKTEDFTLTALNISSKSVTLSSTPVTLTKTRLIPEGGIECFYSDDFTVSGTTVSWAGLGLDGLLEENDKIKVIYS